MTTIENIRHDIIEESYYFDKVRIIMRQPKKVLANLLPLRKLNELSGRCHLDSLIGTCVLFGFKSKLEIESPTNETLELLLKNEIHMPGYKISYIEIARDEIYFSKEESRKAFAFVLKNTRKKYSFKQLTYRQDVINPSDIDEEKYSDSTGYWGSDGFKYVVYPRISKVLSEPCVHSEWRIKGASSIKEKIGLSTIYDMTVFDPKSWFDNTTGRLIKLETIDHKKHGQYVINNLMDSPFYLESYKNMQAEEISLLFCLYNGINSTSELLSFYKNLKLNLKGKTGRKSDWEAEINKLSQSMINSFFKAVERPHGNIIIDHSLRSQALS